MKTHTTIKQLYMYFLVAGISSLLVGCSPEQLNNTLTFDSRFYVNAAQDAFVGFGQIPGTTQYVIGTADLVAGEWDIKAGLGSANQALSTSMNAYAEGWSPIGFWAMPLTLRAWIVGQLIGESIEIGASSFVVAPATLFDYPMWMPDGCVLQDGQYVCNVKGS